MWSQLKADKMRHALAFLCLLLLIRVSIFEISLNLKYYIHTPKITELHRAQQHPLNLELHIIKSLENV